jgi:hypothetical protein
MRVNTFSAVFVAIVAAIGFMPGCSTDLEVETEQSDFEEPYDDGSNIELQGVYDCTERADTGYTSGSRTPISVVSVDARPVEVDTANAYIAMQEAARRDGVSVRIVSGFRTNAEQTRLYSCYTNCNCNSCNLAARPGFSNHQSGHALDLNTRDAGVLNWLNRNGARFGFRRTVPSEAWHWEWWGNASDFDGPCGIAAPTPSQNAAPDDCGVVQSGGVIEEDGACVTLGGPTQYLRSVDDQYANDGDLVWTGATANTTAGNYGIWWVKVPAAGRYRVEAWINRTYATSQQAKYSVRHNGTTDVVTLNLTTAGGFRSLGEFQFSGAAGERVRLDDNTGERSALGRKLVFDGLRITRIDGATTPTPTTGACTEVRITAESLNVRPTASTAQAARGTLSQGQVVTRVSSVEGQEVRGDTTWYAIDSGSLEGFVSAAFAECVN